METEKYIINLPKNKVAENISVKTENDKIVVNYDLKVMAKFTIKDLAEGRCAVKNVGLVDVILNYLYNL